MNTMPHSPLLIYSSPYCVNDTADKIEHLLNSKQVTVFCRINHAQAATDVGLDLQPEILLVFGSPKVGTPLMQERPEIGIELPLKILIWQQDNHTYVGHQDLINQLEKYQVKENQTIISDMQNFLLKLIECALKEEGK